MIIETTSNKLYRVVETGVSGLEHCWYGIPVKLKRASGAYIMTAAGERAYKNGRPELVSKAHLHRIVKGGA
jgi:hypothetical protein